MVNGEMTQGMKIANGIVLAFLFLSWIIFLAGIGRTEALCIQTFNDGAVTNSFGSTGSFIANGRKMLGFEDDMGYPQRRLLYTALQDCGMQVSLYWWTLFLELFFLILATIMVFSANFNLRCSGLVIAIKVIVTVQLTLTSDTFVKAAWARRGESSPEMGAVRTVAAGAVLLTIFDYLWLIINCLQAPPSA